MNENRDNKSPGDPLDELLSQHLTNDAPMDVHERAAHHFHLARRTLRGQSEKRSFRRRIAQFFPRLATAGALMAMVVIALLMIPARVSWADVLKKFASVPYFSATVYLKEGGTNAEQERYDFWVAHDRRARLHYKNMIFFSDEGKITVIGPNIEKTELDAAKALEMKLSEPFGMIQGIGKLETFSLDSVLNMMFSEQIEMSPPLPNAEASISSDLLVFDITSDPSPLWMRIWVLKESGLPVRMRGLNPNNSETLDILFDYMNEQPAEAFDPDKVSEAVRTTDGNTNKINSLLKDPGGRPLTPGDLFKKTGYHMPTLEEFGRTSDGVVWVRSSNGTNIDKRGGQFWGFGRLTDDLGQEYIGRRFPTREYFIPVTYQTDYIKPTSYKLTCTVGAEIPGYRFPDVVGTLDIMEWLESDTIPTGYGIPDESFIRSRVMQHLQHNGDWTRLELHLNRIPGEPEESAEALERDHYRLSHLQAMGRKDEALALSTRLNPLDMKDLAAGEWIHSHIWKHFHLLQSAGREQEARAVILQARDILRDSQPKDNEADQYAFFMSDGVRDFALLGIDVTADPRVMKEMKSRRSEADIERMKKEVAGILNQRKFFAMVADLYDKRPLPTGVDVVTDKLDMDLWSQWKLPITFPSINTELAGHEGYRCSLIRGNLSMLAGRFAYERKIPSQLVRMGPGLEDSKLLEIVAYPASITFGDVLEGALHSKGYRINQVKEKCSVWVARYDGRPLPNMTEVKPLEEPPGAKFASESQLGLFDTAMLLASARGALNQVWDGDKVGKREPPIIIIDETGLSGVKLCKGFRFFSGDAAIEPTKKWFEDNFGITFTEEEREITTLVVEPLTAP